MNSMGPMNFFSYDRHDRYDRYNDMETRLKCARDYQIENLAETNFVEIFGRAKQILSVQCVRTHILGKTLKFNISYTFQINNYCSCYFKGN